MYDSKTHTIDHRIVSIHQPHIRPIVRGKAQAKVEFGSKIHVSIVDGISFLDKEKITQELKECSEIHKI